MKIHILYPALCTLLCCTNSHAQKNYLPYHDLINQAEETFVAQKRSADALTLYDKAFNEFPTPFVKDVYVAAQIAFHADDTTRFIRYIKHCFDRGMSFRCLDNGSVFKPLRHKNKAPLWARLEQLYATRQKPSIDSVLRDSVYLRFHREQTFKRKINRSEELHRQYQRMEKANTAYFASQLDEGIFPSEQRIGLFTDEGFADFMKRHGLQPFEEPLPPQMAGMVLTPIPEDYSLWNQAAFVSFLHYPCAFEMYKEGLWKAVENGYLHPKDYCILEEWLATGISNPMYLNDCRPEKKAQYYNITPAFKTTQPKELKQVEANRSERHLQKYSVDVLKKQREQEQGFVFFFGFFDYR